MAQYYTSKHPSLRLVFSCSESLHDPELLQVLADCGFTVLSCQVAEHEKCELVNLRFDYREEVHQVWLYRPLSNSRYAVAYFYGPGRAELAVQYSAAFQYVPLKQLYFLLDAYTSLKPDFLEEICKTLVFMFQPENHVKYLDAAGYECIERLLLSGDIRYVSPAMSLMISADPEQGVALLNKIRATTDDAVLQVHLDSILVIAQATSDGPLVAGQARDESQLLLPFFACHRISTLPPDEYIASISTAHERHAIQTGSRTLQVDLHRLKDSSDEFSIVQLEDCEEPCYALYFNGSDWMNFIAKINSSRIYVLPEELLRTVMVTTDQDDFLNSAAYQLILCTTRALIQVDEYDPRQSLNYAFLKQVQEQLSDENKVAMAVLLSE